MKREIMVTIALWLVALPAMLTTVVTAFSSLIVTSDTMLLGKLVFLPILVAMPFLALRLAQQTAGLLKALQIAAVIANTTAICWLAYRFTAVSKLF
jgi:hypothetical protein